jgi:phage gp36-like protein
MWRQPTTDDFRDAILEDEMIAYGSASISDDKDYSLDGNVVRKAMSNAAGTFRSALRSGYTGIMGVKGTLPDDLIPHAMHIAVYTYIGGRAGAKISDPRKQLYLDAVDMAKRIADGRLAYTDPDDAETDEKPSPAFSVPGFKPKRLTLSRKQQEGL